MLKPSTNAQYHDCFRFSKVIPQFEATYYLAVFSRVCSSILWSQTLDVVGVELTSYLQGFHNLAPGLIGSPFQCSLYVIYSFVLDNLPLR